MSSVNIEFSPEELEEIRRDEALSTESVSSGDSGSSAGSVFSADSFTEEALLKAKGFVEALEAKGLTVAQVLKSKAHYEKKRENGRRYYEKTKNSDDVKKKRAEKRAGEKKEKKPPKVLTEEEKQKKREAARLRMADPVKKQNRLERDKAKRLEMQTAYRLYNDWKAAEKAKEQQETQEIKEENKENVPPENVVPAP
jgi:hypothetical protein